MLTGGIDINKWTHIIFICLLSVTFLGCALFFDGSHLAMREESVNPIGHVDTSTIISPGTPIVPPELAIPSAQAQKTHPYLLFRDIRDTPGYKYRSQSPWNAWEKGIIGDANAALSMDFSKKWGGHDNWVSYRAYLASEVALAYQITKDQDYADKAKEALLNLDMGEVPESPNLMMPEGIRAISLLYYSLAYDWAQPSLDPNSDAVIRDKLAKLADQVYGDLTVYGIEYVSFADFHGQAYPIMGIAGVVLDDYTNPNGLTLSSNPAEWRRVGTDYLFVSDRLHVDRNGDHIALINYQVGSDGKDLTGSYKAYALDDIAWWAQVYTHYYGKNFFEVYPIARQIMTTEVWESLPDGYSNNFVTNGNMKYDYHRAIANLLDPANRSYVLKYDDRVDSATELPYAEIMTHLYYNGMVPDSLQYLVYDNYSSAPRADPEWTSHLGTNSVYQVFRGSWAKDSAWLSLVTCGNNMETYSNRNSEHHDQMSIEYYDKGTLLLADAGEDRHLLDTYEGRYEVHHNTIAIERPERPFSVAPWSDSPARGIFKGTKDRGMVTPAEVSYATTTPWLDMVDSKTTIDHVISTSYKSDQTLPSSIYYERLVLYPDKDYFIIIDRLEGTQEWVYRNIFRPASFDITPTTSSIGHVNGDLSIGGQAYDWLDMPYKAEESTGIQSNSIEWSTKNPYGKSVTMQIYTAPSSEVLVMKNMGRIGGYGAASEVYSPVVYFRSNPQTDLYRVTALLSRQSGEQAKSAMQVPVYGEGNALKVSGQGYDDYIYCGLGSSSFGPFATDADTAFIRVKGGPVEYTLIGGTTLSWSGSPLVGASASLGYLTLKNETNGYSINLSSQGTTDLSLFGLDPSTNYSVVMDGAPYTAFTKADNGTIHVYVPDGEHSLRVSWHKVAASGGTSEAPSSGAAAMILIFLSMALLLSRKK